MPTKEEFLAKFEEALEMSVAISAPANLLPTDLFGDDEVLRDQQWWSHEEELVLIEALEERFGIDRMTLMAEAMNVRDKTVELLGVSERRRFFHRPARETIYIQRSEGHIVYAIGAPGFDFGDRPQPRAGEHHSNM